MVAKAHGLVARLASAGRRRRSSFRVLGFRVYMVWGFRVWGFRVLGFV